MENNQDFSEIMRAARSPAGRKLVELLRASNGAALTQAMQKASSGDYNDAKTLIQKFLETPEAQDLLKDLGG